VDRFLIEGGRPLQGEVQASGSKNSALPAIAACLLTAEKVTLDRIPSVRDIRTMLDLIRHNGAEVNVSGGRVEITAGELSKPEAPYELVKTMRASSLVLGPLVARAGRARRQVGQAAHVGRSRDPRRAGRQDRQPDDRQLDPHPSQFARPGHEGLKPKSLHERLNDGNPRR